jgi:hypothetical protein
MRRIDGYLPFAARAAEAKLARATRLIIVGIKFY